MNKRIFVLISVVLAVVIVAAGVLYARETGKLEDALAEVAGLETGLATAETEVSTLEAALADEEADVSILEADLAAAEARVSVLQAELTAVESRLSDLEAELVAAFPDAGLEAAIREAIYFATVPGARGQVIFENTCMMCHTIGDGILTGPDLKDITSRRDRDWLISFITEPEQLISQEDPLAIQLVEEYDGIVMPNLGLSEWRAEAVLVYIEVYIPQVQPVDQPEGPILKSDLEALIWLVAQRSGVSDITGMEYSINMQNIYFGGNNISDISALADVTHLEALGLGSNNISDISPLAYLTNLKVLYLWGNTISDISPLAGLTDLWFLDLSAIKISDISPLAGLTNLEHLSLWNNDISDISALAGLTNLEELHLGGNSISDISPLVANSGLSDGDTVNLSGNPLSATSMDVYIPQLEARGVIVEY